VAVAYTIHQPSSRDFALFDQVRSPPQTTPPSSCPPALFGRPHPRSMLPSLLSASTSTSPLPHQESTLRPRCPPACCDGGMRRLTPALFAARAGRAPTRIRVRRACACARARPWCGGVGGRGQLLVLWEGRVAYWGAAGGALEHFARLGYACPPRTNPAEFILDLVRI
jgi:hypothetical protein